MSRWILFLALCSALMAQPSLSKVDPPNWWPGHTVNPVRVLLRGTQLQGAKVSARGLAVSNIRVNPAGTYVFADVNIPRNARPGSYPLRVETPQGNAEIAFEVTGPLPAQGRFAGFNQDDVIYLIMPDRFANGDPSNDDPGVSKGLLDRKKIRYYHGGDFAGIQQRLPYLKSLGVTAIWLNPVYDNNNQLNQRERYNNEGITDYHGYGAIDFYAVEEHFGTAQDFRNLVDAAHAAGIKIILDQVANHTGPYHAWVKDPPLPDWFNGTEAKHSENKWQTWTLMNPYATRQMQRETLDGWFINLLPDLNQDNPEVERYINQNTLWWIGMFGLDGIRQDTWPYVPRTFWRSWMSAIKKQYPTVRVVGELFDFDPTMIAFFEGSRKASDGVTTGVDYLFDFPLFSAIRKGFTEKGSLRDVAQMLARDHVYQKPNDLVTFLGLHDVGRMASDPGVSGDHLRLATVFLLTSRGIPLLYYGDEIGMPGGGDPDNRRDFPGGWPGDTANKFEASGRTAGEQAIFQEVVRFSKLRREHEALRRGKLLQLYAEQDLYIYARATEKEVVLVALNKGPDAEVSLDLGQVGTGPGTTDGMEAQFTGTQVKLRIPARSAGIVTGLQPLR